MHADVRQHGDTLSLDHAAELPCPGCRSLLPPHAVFCVECGLTQLSATDSGTVVRHVPGPPAPEPFESTIELAEEDLLPVSEPVRAERSGLRSPRAPRPRPPYVLDPELVAAVRGTAMRATMPSNPIATLPLDALPFGDEHVTLRRQALAPSSDARVGTTEPSPTIRRPATTPPHRPRRATARVPAPPKREAAAYYEASVDQGSRTRAPKITVVAHTVPNPPPAEDWRWHAPARWDAPPQGDTVVGAPPRDPG